jgi:hypothetical protein
VCDSYKKASHLPLFIFHASPVLPLLPAVVNFFCRSHLLISAIAVFAVSAICLSAVAEV